MAAERNTNSAAATYRARVAQLEADLARQSRSDRRLAWGRGLSFLTALGVFGLAVARPGPRGPWATSGVVLLVGFVALAALHESLQQRSRRARRMHRLLVWQLARLARDWKSVPTPRVTVPTEHAAVARDLDVFGHASLFQLINQAHTPAGILTLRDWLLDPASPDEIASRQAAVRVMAARGALRDELALRGYALAESLAGPDQFVRWAEGPAYLAPRRWLRMVATISPLVAIGLLAAWLGHWLSPAAAGSGLVTVLLVHLVLSVLYIGPIHDIFNSISSRSNEMQHYLALFELLDQVPAEAPLLAALQQEATVGGRGALPSLRQLRWIMTLANLRHASLLSLLYVVLQLTMLWDVHVMRLVEWWQTTCGPSARGWFTALGKLEAIASLATLAHNHPDWCFPCVDPELPPGVQATQLGHPLLPNARRVANDVQVGPAGAILLVTGSNMSGKSTLLRSLGLNVLLAAAGGPVCARALHLAPLQVITSMRIQDSLEDGVSFFMAELQRLKAIVDQAVRYQQRGDRTLFYLLDEILQGTNSVERHLAVTRVLKHLADCGAVGAVSTHDLDLARAPELADRCQAVHFRETLHDAPAAGGQMTFDYRLRPGIATTTNALKLLRIVGLD